MYERFEGTPKFVVAVGIGAQFTLPALTNSTINLSLLFSKFEF